MGEAPTHPELLDWLAVEFMRHGWSIKQANRLMMTSAGLPDGRRRRRRRRQRTRIRRTATCGASARSASTPRSCATACWRSGGNINLAVGGEPIFPFIPKDILTGQYRGKWENTPDGPAAWRRGVYVYRRRSLPYPMFDTFDHPDMNVVAGARNVSTVPTQALTLLNNPFVLAQAERLAERVRREASDPAAQVDLAYRIALARPPAPAEREVALELVRAQSLAAFTHVLLNLDEFVYMR